MKKAKKISVPDLTEFTDDEGQRWVQTSTEDLFSTKELNDILESVEKEKEEGDIILARIDFKRVNREYYDSVQELQAKLRRRNDVLKKLIIGSRDTIERKNKKLKELIEYIKKLHMLLAYYKLRPEHADKIPLSPEMFMAPPRQAPVQEVEEVEIPRVGYTEVQEVMLDDEGNETTAV